jgi:hypothetical protein
MPSHHLLTCRRRACGRIFTATRSDARFCSRSCRRRKSPAAPRVEAAPILAQDDNLHGWRRVGGYLIPPRSECFVFGADDWLQ